MPHIDAEHGLTIQLASALKERDEAHTTAAGLRLERDEARERETYRQARVIELQTEAANLRAEAKRLREALESIAAECMAQEDNFTRCDQTTHQIARAALAAPAAAAGEDSK